MPIAYNNKRINNYSCMTYQDKSGSINLSTTIHKRICNTPDCVYTKISDLSNKANSNIRIVNWSNNANSNIHIMGIINHLNTLSPNDRCLFMVNIIKVCASDNNIAELIFRKIYDEYKNFSIFGINGLSSLYVFTEIEFDRDGHEYTHLYETFFINLAIEQNNRQLVGTLISFGVSLDTINFIEIEDDYQHYRIDDLIRYDLPLYKIACSNMLEYIIEKYDILNNVSSQSIHELLVNIICDSSKLRINKSTCNYPILINAIRPDARDYYTLIRTSMKYDDIELFKYLLEESCECVDLVQLHIEKLLNVGCRIVRSYVHCRSYILENILIGDFNINNVSTRVLLKCLIYMIGHDRISCGTKIVDDCKDRDDRDRISLITKIVDDCKDRTDVSFKDLNINHYMHHYISQLFEDETCLINLDITSKLYECFMNVLIPFLSNNGVNCCNIYYTLIFSQPQDTLLLLQKVHQILRDDKYNIALYDILLYVIKDTSNSILSTVLNQLSKYRGKNTPYKDKMKKEYEKIIHNVRRPNLLNLGTIDFEEVIELFCRYKMEDLISCTRKINTSIGKKRTTVYEEVYLLETNFRKMPRDIKFLISKFLTTEDPREFYIRNLKTEKIIRRILQKKI